MGLLNIFKKKKKKENDQVFIMHLLFDEYVDLPSVDEFSQVMSQYLGDIECFNHDQKGAGIALKDYQIELSDGKVPAMLMITNCLSMDDFEIDEISRSQMWNIENADEIIEKAKYHIICVDMMANLLSSKQRAKMNMDYMEAMIHLFPQATAIYFQPSGKLFEREQIIHHEVNENDRFIYFAVNVRLFNIQGANDMLVDTLGMNLLGLPDLQYHFHDYDVNDVVNHAYNMCSYMFDNEKIIENGDYIDAIIDGHFRQDIGWVCHHEESLIEPTRAVIDICMNEYASGKRKYKE